MNIFQVDADTGGRGVVLVMADGGDSVDGEFLKQARAVQRFSCLYCVSPIFPVLCDSCVCSVCLACVPALCG